METTLLFSIAVVLCFVIGVTSATEVSEVKKSIFDIERTSYTWVDKVVNKQFHFNGSGLEQNQAEECKCKNGKCMRVCDRDKTTPCQDQRKVCVCDPMFAKKSDDECEYCDCGEDFNCTFTKNYYGRWQKNCICPKGYYFSDAGKCIAKCNSLRDCENGGTCSYGSCSCPDRTTGYFCENIPACSSKCQNRLEVRCSYNRYKLVVECDCKDWSLYYDEKEDICKPCPCGNSGHCYYEYGYSDRKLRCSCDFGYKEFNGYCKECQCGPGSNNRCEFDSKGEKICKCLDGFYEREGQCLPCECMSSSDTDTKCEVNGTQKRCFCPELYQDVLGRCEVTQVNPCETNNTCHRTAKCFNIFGKIACECPEGYKGSNGGKEVEPGEVCNDMNECEELTNACWYSYRVKCVNVPGSYRCECMRGFEPESYQDQPQKTYCIATSKNVVPSVIVAFITLGLMITSCCMHKRVKKRATS